MITTELKKAIVVELARRRSNFAGSDAKFATSIGINKVGYTELFSRYGSRYQKATPDSNEETKEFCHILASFIIKANDPDADIKKMIAATDGSLRRIFDEIRKSRRSA